MCLCNIYIGEISMNKVLISFLILSFLFPLTIKAQEKTDINRIIVYLLKYILQLNWTVGINNIYKKIRFIVWKKDAEFV